MIHHRDTEFTEVNYIINLPAMNSGLIGPLAVE